MLSSVQGLAKYCPRLQHLVMSFRPDVLSERILFEVPPAEFLLGAAKFFKPCTISSLSFSGCFRFDLAEWKADIA